MAFKRRYHGPAVGRWKRFRRTGVTKYRKSRPMSSSRRFKSARFSRAVMRAVNRNAETKEVMREIKSNHVLYHNGIRNLDNNAFFSDIGVHGGNHQNQFLRNGNKLFCKGIKVSIMLENQQYRPQASYWLYLVRLKAGRMDDQIVTASDMYEGVSSTLPMDYIDTAKCDVLFSKKFVVKMPNSGSTLAMGGTANGAADIESNGASYEVVTNPQVIRKFYVPINKTIMYRDSDSESARKIPASYRYQWVMMTYNNHSSTAENATYPVGHVTMSTIMKFTDV